MGSYNWMGDIHATFSNRKRLLNAHWPEVNLNQACNEFWHAHPCFLVCFTAASVKNAFLLLVISHCGISVWVIVLASFRGQGRANCNQQKGKLRSSPGVVFVTSYYWTRQHNKTVYKEERLIFRSRLERFLFMLSLCRSKNIATERHGGGRLFTSQQPGSKRGQKQENSLQDTAPVINLLAK